MIYRFKDNWPVFGDPIWVWINGRWTVACLSKGMYPLHDERAKLQWDLLSGECRKIHDEDLYVEMVLPEVLPPPGSHGDAQ